MVEIFRNNGKKQLSLLDIGAGTGFWTDLVSSAFLSEGIQTAATVLDISKDALDIVAERLPHVRRYQEDLATIQPDKYANSFDLVTSFYCIHHIVRSNDFLNALRFSALSVKDGGFLLIMDPVLTKAYSKFDLIDWESFHGNGIPRHLYFIDDILADLQFKRYSIRPAVSYILNGCIEARGAISYNAMSGLWKLLCVFYKSEKNVSMTGGLLTNLDATLKRLGMAFSSSICLYQKNGK
jgi:SAM-dependent methyltransferase